MAEEKVILNEAEMKKQQMEIKLIKIKEKLQSTDFGKLRQDVVNQAERLYPVAESLAAEIVENPIILANIVNIFPPLINNLIKLTSTTLSRIDLPSEILANAVFNLTLSDIEAEELGRCINELARLINGIHEGSLILDKDEPRFREVARSFLEGVTTPFDHEALATAAVALCDNLEILCQVMTDVITEKPELFEGSFSSLLLSLNASVRGFNYALEKVGTLPPPLFEHLARELKEKVDYREIGKLVNSLLSITDRLLQENPVLFEESLSAFFESVDKELLKKVVRELSSQVETQKLTEAMVKSSSQIAGVLANHPTLSRALIKSGALILGGAIRGYFKSFFVRRR